MKSYIFTGIMVLLLASGQLFMDKSQVIAVVIVGIMLMAYSVLCHPHPEEDHGGVSAEGERFFAFGYALVSNICYLFTHGFHPVAGFIGNTVLLGMLFYGLYLGAITSDVDESAV